MFGGGVGTVTYKALAGLANAGVAWRKIAMRPLPAAIEVLGVASASVLSPHGLAAISWRLDVNSDKTKTFVLNATVPVGSTAEIVLPMTLVGAGKISSVMEKMATVVWKNGKYFAPAGVFGFLGFSLESSPYEALTFKVGSGCFRFIVALT
jgi:hypothetical protein